MSEIYESNPTVAEVIHREADIVMKQCCGFFASDTVRRVLQEVERRTRQRGHSEKILSLLSAFNYGYILGKRAERARRKAAKT